MANAQNTYDGYDKANTDPRLVDADFIENQSLSAKGFNPDRKRRKGKKGVVNYAFKKAVALAGYEDEFENIASLWDQLVGLKQQGAKDAAKQAIKNILQKLLLSRLAPWLYYISLVIYALQLVFALTSLAGIGAMAAIETVATDTTLGKVANFTLGLFGTSLQNLIPAEYLALGFWALASIVSMMGFVGFMLVFNRMGVHMMRSTLSSLILFTSMAFALLPVGNLIPTLFLWVFYVVRSETSVFGMFLDHHSTTHAYNAPLRDTAHMMSTNIAQRQKLSE